LTHSFGPHEKHPPKSYHHLFMSRSVFRRPDESTDFFYAARGLLKQKSVVQYGRMEVIR